VSRSNAYETLYSAVQIALRNVIRATGIEDVLGQKADLGKNLKELVDPVAKQFGYELDAVQVRDLMIVGDLKRVFTQVMSAKQEAPACLEKARGEAAAIRVMGNAARVYENSPALLQLQFLKTLEGAGYNNQLIMGPLDPLTSFLRK
jgi:regulator of protease activity HflC (stomatin/prohibitin superfamily)